MHDGLSERFSDNWGFEDLMNNFLSVLDVSGLEVSLSDDRDVLLFNESGVLLVDDGLMVLVNVLLVNDGLVVLMDNVLVMFVNDIFLVLNENIFVMLMDNILMDFFHDGGKSVGLSHISLINSHELLTFVEGFHDSLFVVLNDKRLFVDLLNNSLICLHHHWLVVLVNVTEALSLNKVGLLEGLSERLVESGLSSEGRSLESSG